MCNTYIIILYDNIIIYILKSCYAVVTSLFEVDNNYMSLLINSLYEVFVSLYAIVVSFYAVVTSLSSSKLVLLNSEKRAEIQFKAAWRRQ